MTRADVPRRGLSPVRAGAAIALVATLLALFAGTSGPAGAAERIAAIVNKNVILASEVDDRFQQAAARFGVDPRDSVSVAKLRRNIIDQLVENQVVLAEATRLGLTATPAEVQAAVDREIGALRERLGGEAGFRRALEQERMTEADLRKRYEPDVREQLLISRVVSREVQSKTTVTDAEVRAFYDANRDSIGKKPEQLKLAHILIAFEADSAQAKRARARADSIRALIVKGRPFEEAAKQFSDDPSGQRGGDLGPFGHGDMVPEFETVAFSLKPGDMSQPVRTRFGYHIIKVDSHQAKTDSTEELVRARHVMIGIRPTPNDEERARKRALVYRDSLKAGADFAAMAKRHSMDTATKDSGGVLGDISVASLPDNLREVLTGLSVNEISVPVKRDAGYHIFKLLGRVAEEDFKYDDIKDELRQMVMNKKLEESYRRWYERVKKTVTIEIKD
ncbi:MAG TPA: peptidylprolyl isomerase [Candidatus Eisenbacteria bacterium]|nr:peptidylprolyl isomerase [Candidatus Eisenbacteria bacterium]